LKFNELHCVTSQNVVFCRLIICLSSWKFKIWNLKAVFQVENLLVNV
jgi:hypothetical protein